MSRIILLIAAFVTIFTQPLEAQKIKQQDLFEKRLYKNNNMTLPYRLLKPANLQVKDSFPLVIFLHGAGERGADNEVHIQHIADFALNPKHREKYPCFVLAPQCPKGEVWAVFEPSKDELMATKPPTQTMTALIELIEKIIQEFPIDKSRIYITGLSMGGYGTWDLIARFPNKFAAAVPICGGGSPKTAFRIKHIPVWAFHGARDEVVSPQSSRRMIKALHDAGGSPGYTEYPGVAHNSWDFAYAEPYLIQWLFKQKLQSQPSK